MTEKQDMGVVTLLPCPVPWCREAEQISFIVSHWSGAACVECLKCKARGPYENTKEVAITAWNTRLASQADQGAALNWSLIAKLAGEHGIRYRTNSALEKFLSAIAQPVAEMECPAHGNPGQYIGVCCQEAHKRNGKIGHKSGCVKINCAGCGDDFYSKDYSATHPQPSQKGEGDE